MNVKAPCSHAVSFDAKQIYSREARWPHTWLVRSSLDQAVRVRALVGDIVLFSWTRLLSLTVPLSTQVYK